MADQPRRGAVENAAHGEGAAAGDARFVFDKIGGTPCRQVEQLLALNAKRGAIAPIAA